MGEDPPKDAESVIFHVYKTMEKLDKTVDSLDEKVGQLATEIALMKQSHQGLKTRLKDGAAPASIGTVFAALLMGVWEYFKAKQ